MIIIGRPSFIIILANGFEPANLLHPERESPGCGSVIDPQHIINGNRRHHREDVIFGRKFSSTHTSLEFCSFAAKNSRLPSGCT